MNNYTNDMGPLVAMSDPEDPWNYQYIRNPFFESADCIGSFENYLKGHYQDQYYSFLENSIISRYVPIGKKSHLVPEPDYILIKDIHEPTFQFYQLGRSQIRVDAAIRADIILKTQVGNIETADLVSQLYRINGTVTFSEKGESFFDLFQEISVYEMETIPAPLSPYLVPYIRKGDYDQEAENLLEQIYPEVLSHPSRVDAKEFAQRLGLKIACLKMTSDRSILGKLFFEDDIIDYYKDDGSIGRTRIPAKTIVIDYEACQKYKGGRVNLTIFHECVHYLKHYFFYCVQYLYNSDIRYLSCTGTKASTITDHDSPIYWIEKQADLLAFSLQMPAGITKATAHSFYERLVSKYPDKSELFILEKLVVQIAEFFNVSKQCAQIRLQELGFAQLKGVLNYVNGNYIRSYTVSNGSLNQNETVTISLEDAGKEYQRNDAFRKIIDTGRFIYVEGHFCLNKPLYLYKDKNGTKRLTTYARTHMNECCLVFQMKSGTAAYKYTEGSLSKESPTAFVVVYPGKCDAEATAIQESPSDSATRILNILNDPQFPRDFAGTLCYHMERLNVSKGDIADTTGWDEKTVQRFRNREDRPSDIKSVIVLCIVLKLDPDLSADLIDKAGFRLRETHEDFMYRLIIRHMYTASLDEINNTLLSCGLKPLLKQVA